MTLPVVPMPDVEAVVIGYLSGVLDGGVTVASEWPEDVAGHLPAVAVSRGGGAMVQRFVIDEPTVDIDVLAADKGAAHDLAQQVRAELFAAENRTLAGAHIYRVDDVSLIWLPWQAAEGTAPIARYVLVMSLRVRPVS